MISFQTAGIPFNLKDRTVLRNWVLAEIRRRKRSAGDIAFVFCDDEYLLAVNRQYLDHDTYTDIITFDYSKEDASLPVSGDIFISIDRVKENAGKFGKTFREELHRVMIHGTLHLLGHKDKSKADKATMTAAEDEALRRLKI